MKDVLCAANSTPITLQTVPLSVSRPVYLAGHSVNRNYEGGIYILVTGDSRASHSAIASYLFFLFLSLSLSHIISLPMWGEISKIRAKISHTLISG